jgi:hypothetical protein
MNRTCRVGVHGRNDVEFHEPDYSAIREAKIETLKMMSQTRVDHFRRLKEIRPDIEFVTRLYDDRFGKQGHPSPEEFAQRITPVMQQLQPYCAKFEVHNEPNHLDRIEGWGDTDDDARNFNAWFLRVYSLLKQACPWAQLGFPGLAIPHRDLEWIEICRPAVEKADWLGVHCYWQTPENALHNHLADFWGLRFKYYHQKFPDKIIELTEVGNSNAQSGIPFTEASHAREFTEYLTECFKYPYLNSACFFILSSPDPTWDGFTWRSQDGRHHEVVRAVRDMFRPHWAPAQKPAEIQPALPASTEFKEAAQAAPPGLDALLQLQEENRQLQNVLQEFQTQNNQLQSHAQQLQALNNQLVAQLQQAQRQIGAPGGSSQQPRIISQVSSTPVVAKPRPIAPSSPAPVIARRPPAMQNLSQRLTRHPTAQTESRQLHQIERIIIHHTAVAPHVGAERIAEFLVKNHNRPGISYHYFITAEGIIQQTNLLTTITLQSNAQLNPGAVGLGFAGNFNETAPPPPQIEAGAQLIAWLLQELQLSPQAVFGHKELVSTQSPGVQWDSGAQWGQQLRQRIQTLLVGGQ